MLIGLKTMLRSGIQAAKHHMACLQYSHSVGCPTKWWLVLERSSFGLDIN
jgi:hypothetical protein